jgi:hypothetical protein
MQNCANDIIKNGTAFICQLASQVDDHDDYIAFNKKYAIFGYCVIGCTVLNILYGCYSRQALNKRLEKMDNEKQEQKLKIENLESIVASNINPNTNIDDLSINICTRLNSEQMDNRVPTRVSAMNFNLQDVSSTQELRR